MSKPAAGSGPLRWGTAPLVPGDLTQPDNTHKDHGWQDAEEPPHSFFNYWMNLVYLWLVYLDGLTGEALTWTVGQTFSAGIAVVGGAVIDTATITTATITTLNATTLMLSGAATVGGALNVTGTAHLNGNALVGGTLGVSGATSLAGLSTSGNAAVGGTLGVTGTTTLANTVIGTLSVTGVPTLHNGLAVAHGDVTLTDGVLTAVGNASPHQFGAVEVNAGLEVLGVTQLDNTLNVTGPINANGGINVPLVTNASMHNGWVDVNAAVYRPAGYLQAPDGECELQGYITGSDGTSVFTSPLPLSMRPPKAVVLLAFSDGGTHLGNLGSVLIAPNGVVTATLATVAAGSGGSAFTNISLEGLRWRP